MLKYFSLIYFIFLSLFLFSCKQEQEKISGPKISPDTTIDHKITEFQRQFLGQQIDSVFAKYDFNGSVGVFDKENVLYRKNQGFENFANKIKLNDQSVFAIASISKQFTAVLILLQEEKGKLSTEDPVSNYLKEFQTRSLGEIKIKELLNHTSGISDSGNGVLSKPVQKFHYSNKGYRYLGEIIEKVTGKSYEENAKEIFQNIGMNNSSSANLFIGNHFANAYLGNDKIFQKVQNMPKRLAKKEISVPAGGILSTIADLHLWNSKLYNGEILNLKYLKKMTEKSADRNHPVLGKMNYGFGLMSSKKEPFSYFHSGYVKGAPSLNIYYPETKMSVIILSNIANESKGKNAIFDPHKKIKEITDSLQIASLKKKNELLQIK